MAKNRPKTPLKVTVCNFCTFAKRTALKLVVATESDTKYGGAAVFVFITFVKSPQKAHFILFDFCKKMVIIPNAIG